MNPFQLNGRTAVVTGGGTGIGLGIARCLSAAGARVVVAGRRQDALAAAAAEIGGEIATAVVDVSDHASLRPAVAAIDREHGPVSILVNCAGNYIRGPAEELTDAELASLIEVHVGGAFALTREFGRGMLERGDGSVVCIGSLNASIGMPNVVGYSAAKAALFGMVHALAAEWAARGVRVNLVVPGWIDAGMAKRAFSEDTARRDRALARTPMGRLGAPEDVGWAVVYLCSAAAGFVTGTALYVDGGALVGF
jgi:NAD(P)-dependent dehydrogenase (short-subunit alcohol dehydrogenase family)